MRCLGACRGPGLRLQELASTAYITQRSYSPAAADIDPGAADGLDPNRAAFAAGGGRVPGRLPGRAEQLGFRPAGDPPLAGESSDHTTARSNQDSGCNRRYPGGSRRVAFRRGVRPRALDVVRRAGRDRRLGPSIPPSPCSCGPATTSLGVTHSSRGRGSLYCGPFATAGSAPGWPNPLARLLLWMGTPESARVVRLLHFRKQRGYIVLQVRGGEPRPHFGLGPWGTDCALPNSLP
jgi:hypothetical protein